MKHNLSENGALVYLAVCFVCAGVSLEFSEYPLAQQQPFSLQPRRAESDPRLSVSHRAHSRCSTSSNHP